MEPRKGGRGGAVVEASEREYLTTTPIQVMEQSHYNTSIYAMEDRDCQKI